MNIRKRGLCSVYVRWTRIFGDHGVAAVFGVPFILFDVSACMGKGVLGENRTRGRAVAGRPARGV